MRVERQGDRRVAFVAIVLVTVVLLLLGCAGARAEEAKPPAAPEGTAQVEPSEGEAREAAWVAALKQTVEANGCPAVKQWESVARWVRAVELNCDGLSVLVLFAWQGARWLRSEPFAPQDPAMVR